MVENLGFEEWKRKNMGLEPKEKNFDDIDPTLFLMSIPEIPHDFQRISLEYRRIINELIEKNNEKK